MKTLFEKNRLYLYTIKFYLCTADYLKHNNNDTPKLKIHKYTNYNIIELYINRLSTTTQIFKAMDYSIMMSEKCFHFRKILNHLGKTLFSHSVELTASMYFGNIFQIMRSSNFSKVCPKTWNNWKLEQFRLHQS